ncbi:winged helix-turn-helix domain-containing protein [Paraburkholderia kirstenboschensis]|uniref:winged helix-turn-helix domain-containing protein n=1 Tax=Paraburkholderia kirstenboschensis TaxID=1245436 RepID=UPI003742B7C4
MSRLDNEHPRSTVYRHGALQLDDERKTAFKGDRPLLLRPREFALLKILMKEPNRPFARTKLSEVLSGGGAKLRDNAVDLLVRRLRKKLGPETILTLLGRGYKLSGAQ